MQINHTLLSIEKKPLNQVTDFMQNQQNVWSSTHTVTKVSEFLLAE